MNSKERLSIIAERLTGWWILALKGYQALNSDKIGQLQPDRTTWTTITTTSDVDVTNPFPGVKAEKYQERLHSRNKPS